MAIKRFLKTASTGSFSRVKLEAFWKKRLPPLQWVPHYTLSEFLQDVLAGFTVALTEIPQGMAYAVVAGLSPEYGLYSGFMGGFIYFLFGTCKDINIGPTSIMSLLLQKHVEVLGADAAVLMAFTSGVLIFVLGLLNLGFLIEFFSYPVIAGFTCAASLQIASSQIKSLLGLPGKANEFLEAWEAVVMNFQEISKWDTILGVVSIAVLICLKEIRVFGSLQYNPKWTTKRNYLGHFIFILSLARNALVVLVGTIISYNLGDDNPFKLTGDVKAGFPPFQAPPFSIDFNNTHYNYQEVITNFGASFVFIPIVSILEAISIAKSFSKGKSLDATQEMLALGICNFMGSFVRSMPVTGSFTRTAVNNASGVRTTFGGIVTCVLVLLAVAFLTKSFYYIPKATLAAVIVCAMLYLFEFGAFVTFWKNKKLDFVPFLTTLFCCLFISLEYGILIGIAVNLLSVLYASARPKLFIHKEEDVVEITPRDTLYFPANDFLRATILEYVDEEIIIVVNGKYVRNIDVTIAKGIAFLAQELRVKNQKIVFLNFKDSVRDVCVGIDDRVKAFFQKGDLEETLVKEIDGGHIVNL